MKIIHNIALSVDQNIQQKFANLGVHLELGFSSFKICESEPKWRDVSILADSLEAVDTIKTNFTEAEIKRAQYLFMAPKTYQGYPEPSDDFGYVPIVYDTTKVCSSCNVGLIQKGPFYLSGEPKWGKNNILQLNWIFDEFFVKPDIWRHVFEPFGIEYREVTNIKTQQPLRSIVQLIIPNEKICFLTDDSYPSKTCTKCHETKYSPITRGFFPSLNRNSNKAAFKTIEHFGSGHDAHRAIVVSQDLYNSMKNNNLKGVTFSPCLN